MADEPLTMRAIARKGGLMCLANQGRDHYRRIGRAGGRKVRDLAPPLQQREPARPAPHVDAPAAGGAEGDPEEVGHWGILSAISLPDNLAVSKHSDGGAWGALGNHWVYREGGEGVSDPFLIEGPALISFSGGRTSAYMLRRILDAGLQPEVYVVFADTGREREETYQFVRECSKRWGVKVYWTHRKGKFDRLLTTKRALPNTVQRFCTEKLKLEPIWGFGKAHFEHWTSVIGIRHDEPRRVAKIRGRKPMSFEDVCLPLADARVTLADVMGFWAAQPFDLQLQPWEGNCDLCFLKAQYKRVRVMQDRPDLALKWIEDERRTGRTYRAAPRPTYQRLFEASQLPRLPMAWEGEEDLADCVCGD